MACRLIGDYQFMNLILSRLLARRMYGFYTTTGLLFISSLGFAQSPLPVQWTYSQSLVPNSIAYSPDSTKVAIGSAGGIQIYTVSSGAAVCFPSEASSVSAVAFSPDGTMMADGGHYQNYSGSHIGVLEVWNVSTGKLIQQIPTTMGDVYSVAFSPDSKIIAAGGQANLTSGIIELWNPITGAKGTSITTLSTVVHSVAFSTDGSALADGGSVHNYLTNLDTGVLEEWSVSTGAAVSTMATTATNVTSISFSKDGKTLADGGVNPSGGVLELWDAKSYKSIAALSPSASQSVNSVAFSPDSASLAAGGLDKSNQGALEVWGVAAKTQAASITTFANNGVSALAYSPDGKYLYDGGTDPNYNAIQEVWSAPTYTFYNSYSSSSFFNIFSLAFSSDGQTLVSGGYPSNIGGGGYLALWNAVTGAQAGVLATGAQNVAGAAFAPSGATLAVGGFGPSRNAILELWNTSTQSLIYTLPTTANVEVKSVSFSSDGTKLATNGQMSQQGGQYKGVLEVWNVATGQKDWDFPTGLNFPQVVKLSPDGSTMANGGEALEIWKIPNNSSYTTLGTAAQRVRALLFTSDGNSLVVGGSALTAGVLEVWNVAGLTLSATLKLAPGTTAVWSLAFTPDGKALVAGTDAGIQVFNWSNLTLDSTYPFGNVAALVESANASLAFTNAAGGFSVGTVPALKSVVVTGLTVNPVSVVSGGNSLGTFTLSQAAPIGGAAVSLTSSDPSVTLPPGVTVPAGATTATFTMTTTGVSSQVVATITAGSGTGSKTATLTVTPAGLTTLNINPSSVVGGNAATGTVVLNGYAGPSGTVVTLSATAGATVPTSVTVPSGQSSASFTLNTSGVSSQVISKVSASLAGITQTANLTVTPAQFSLLSVTPSIVSGGTSVTGQVSLNGNAGTKPVTISLTSSSPAAPVPPSVVIAAGQSSASFTVKTLGVASQKVATITAKNGTVIKTATVTLNPPVLASLNLNPTTVYGAGTSAGTVTISFKAPTGGMIIKLASNSKAASVPATVTIAAGSTLAKFTVKTIAVAVNSDATITATLNGQTMTGTLTDRAPTVASVTLSPTSVKGGATSFATVKIDSLAPVGGFVITLASDTSSATVPTSVTVPAGKNTATFAVKTKAVTTTTTANIKATNGQISYTAHLTIS